jgi:hypothetical protein
LATTVVVKNSIRDELLAVRAELPLEPGPAQTGVDSRTGKPAEREQKKNYAQKLSDVLALKIANGLRPMFPGILPVERGANEGDQPKSIQGLESLARSLKGVKRLDVNFSTVLLGLGLGLSIKTLNFKDKTSKRYTKNVTRIDNELRAEASDYHERQPFAVLVGIVFLPIDSADDGKISSFGHAAQTFRYRTGRRVHTESANLFERLYIALYEAQDESRLGDIICFDVSRAPPRTGLPASDDRLTLQTVLEQCVQAFFERNTPRQLWAEVGPEDKVQALEEIADLARSADAGDDGGEDDDA